MPPGILYAISALQFGSKTLTDFDFGLSGFQKCHSKLPLIRVSQALGMEKHQLAELKPLLSGTFCSIKNEALSNSTRRNSELVGTKSLKCSVRTSLKTDGAKQL